MAGLGVYKPNSVSRQRQTIAIYLGHDITIGLERHFPRHIYARDTALHSDKDFARFSRTKPGRFCSHFSDRSGRALPTTCVPAIFLERKLSGLNVRTFLSDMISEQLSDTKSIIPLICRKCNFDFKLYLIHKIRFEEGEGLLQCIHYF